MGGDWDCSLPAKPKGNQWSWYGPHFEEQGSEYNASLSKASQVANGLPQVLTSLGPERSELSGANSHYLSALTRRPADVHPVGIRIRSDIQNAYICPHLLSLAKEKIYYLDCWLKALLYSSWQRDPSADGEYMLLRPMEKNVQFNLQPIREGETKKQGVESKGVEHQVVPLPIGPTYGGYLCSCAADRPLQQRLISWRMTCSDDAYAFFKLELLCYSETLPIKDLE